MKTTIPLYQALTIAVIAVMLSTFLTTTWLDTKASSAESHRVFNYIKANGLPASWEARFNAINSDWPPSRNKLAGLLLDAHAAVAQRASK